MRRILYLADPNSIHDIKWMSFFSQQEEYECFCIARRHHVKSESDTATKLSNVQINFLGCTSDYSVAKFWRNPGQAKEIKALIQRYKIDAFHIMYAEPNALWGLYRNSFKIPMVLTTRGTDVLQTIPQFRQGTSLLSKLVFNRYKKAFASFDEICGTSIRQSESIHQMFGKQLSDFHLIRTGVDIVELKKTVTPIEGKYIFFPRVMRPIYDHELALQAIGGLTEKIRKEYKFVFIGKNGTDQSYVEALKTKISDHSVQKNIHFLDSLDKDEMFQYYQHASLVVMTPKSDGTPVSALEAMLCKAPLIIPNLAYDEELFSSVLKYTAGDADDLTRKIQSKLDDDASDAEEKNLQAVIAHGDRKKEMSKLAQIYSNLVHGPARRSSGDTKLEKK
ncbi:MAG: glycosyltransferase family 4 protein [Reichenbachiella sp.]|uniref:glycosyltransferase family 4 protein n=1 Tax=Reichenbachiella sp. TaxID=2184521 RepID=UPI00326398BB